MPTLIIRGVVLLGGLFLGDKVVKSSGDAIENASELTKWLVIGGVVYTTYAAAKAAGAIK